MRLSEFWRRMDDEFGASYARVLADHQVLGALDGRAAGAALEAGVPARAVWEAMCEHMEVPPERRFGIDRPGRR